MSPYVGMARKQNGGYNASISVQTLWCDEPVCSGGSRLSYAGWEDG